MFKENTFYKVLSDVSFMQASGWYVHFSTNDIFLCIKCIKSYDTLYVTIIDSNFYNKRIITYPWTSFNLIEII